MTALNKIKNYDVQSVNIQASTAKVFEFIADPANLPKWTGAFKEADEKTAVLITPGGELKIGLETKTNRESGTIDWYMTMPDGSFGVAYSRIVAGSDKTAIYSFVLLAPPVPLEQLEGSLFQQMEQLNDELQKLQSILGQY